MLLSLNRSDSRAPAGRDRAVTKVTAVTVALTAILAHLARRAFQVDSAALANPAHRDPKEEMASRERKAAPAYLVKHPV